MATAANFAATPLAGQVLVGPTANTNVNGSSGTYYTVVTAGASGSRIDSIKLKGQTADGSTQAADAVRFFLFDGTNNYLFTEVLVAAGGANVSASVANFETVIALGIPLPAGWSIKASTRGGSTYSAQAFGGSF